MTKKLMLLAAGALTALAFAALPAVAAAGEYEAHCKSGAAVCEGVISGGAASLTNTAGEPVTCTSVTGTASLTSTTSTGTVELTFHGCKETVTIFKFACNSTGQPSGTITTNTMVSHIVNLEAGGTTPGILITGANVTFECTGFAKKTVTGNILGHFEEAHCNEYSATHKVNFEQTGPGQQKQTQVTTTGTVFDLISNNDAGGAYSTSSQTGTGTITWTPDEVNITC